MKSVLSVPVLVLGIVVCALALLFILWYIVTDMKLPKGKRTPWYILAIVFGFGGMLYEAGLGCILSYFGGGLLIFSEVQSVSWLFKHVNLGCLAFFLVYFFVGIIVAVRHVLALKKRGGSTEFKFGVVQVSFHSLLFDKPPIIVSDVQS